jgi:hypothetical protein
MATDREPEGAAGVPAATESAPAKETEPEDPIGPFPTWGRLYATVFIYGAILILILLILTRVLDPGTP